MNLFYPNPHFLTHVLSSKHLTLAVGPWIPQTPDSQFELSPNEQWEEGGGRLRISDTYAQSFHYIAKITPMQQDGTS